MMPFLELTAMFQTQEIVLGVRVFVRPKLAGNLHESFASETEPANANPVSVSSANVIKIQESWLPCMGIQNEPIPLYDQAVRSVEIFMQMPHNEVGVALNAFKTGNLDGVRLAQVMGQQLNRIKRSPVCALL